MSSHLAIWTIIALLLVIAITLGITISAELLHVNGRYDERQILVHKQAGFITMCTLAGLLFLDSIVSRFIQIDKFLNRPTTDMLILAVGLLVYIMYITWNEAYFHTQEIRNGHHYTAYVIGFYFIFTAVDSFISSDPLIMRILTTLVYALLALAFLSIPIITFIKGRKTARDYLSHEENEAQ